MPLSVMQQYQVARKVHGLALELGTLIELLDDLAQLRADYGPEVEDYLSGIISVAEWQASREWAVSRRDLLIARAKAKLGDDLGALRQ